MIKNNDNLTNTFIAFQKVFQAKKMVGLGLAGKKFGKKKEVLW
ncbi:hypothetical protein [Moraxella oblonga]|nr:hypothetical protein [Moraxella oblonga]